MCYKFFLVAIICLFACKAGSENQRVKEYLQDTPEVCYRRSQEILEELNKMNWQLCELIKLGVPESEIKKQKEGILMLIKDYNKWNAAIPFSNWNSEIPKNINEANYSCL